MKLLKEDKRVKINRNNQDIAQKAFMMQYKKGTKPLIGLNYDTLPIKQVLPTGIQNVETIDDEADCLFQLEDGSLLHIEFQSTYKQWDIIRFCKYHIQFYENYKEELEPLQLKEKIKTIVVYTKNLENKDVREQINTGNLTFNMESILITELPGDEEFSKIKEKIKAQPDVELTDKEEQILIYNPYMSKEQSLNDRTLEVAELISHLKQEEKKFKLLGTLATIMYKHLDTKTLEEIWEVFRMGAVFERFQKERDEEMKRKGLKLASLVVNMIKEGKDIEVIKEKTDLSEDEIEDIKKDFNL